ncbi:MAG: TIGR00730 family Rossman fold protein [Aestuariivita sp.]|nr:TIGR00730 family Rossman fold protein [Aestuariivita sp.]
MTTKSICVYCGSRNGSNPVFSETVKSFGQAIAERGWRLVYGSGDIGLMGEVANSAQSVGGETFGVIPQHLVDREIAKTDLSRYVVTETMHERKKVMFMNADMIAVLPGGAGTLDEFFEVFTWAQLELHTKPIVILNIADYWTPLINLIHHIVKNDFADTSLLDMVSICSDVTEAIQILSKA